MTDNERNVSGVSSQKCTTVPINDRQLRTVGPWRRMASKGAYLNDVSRATKKGALLGLDRVTAKTLAVLYTRCPTCGRFKIMFNNQTLKTVDSFSFSVKKKQVVEMPPFSLARTGLLKIVVVTNGKPVLIEGVGASRR